MKDAYTFTDHGDVHPDYDEFVSWLSVEQAKDLYAALERMVGKPVVVPSSPESPWKVTYSDGTSGVR